MCRSPRRSAAEPCGCQPCRPDAGFPRRPLESGLPRLSKQAPWPSRRSRAEGSEGGLNMAVRNQSLRSSMIWAVIGAALAVLVGVIVWSSYFRGTHISSRGALCQPRSVTPPGNVTDAYDRRALSLGPVLYLPLSNPSSGTVQDLSGNGNNGVYLPGQDPPATAHLPNGDPAASFDGRQQYVQVPSASTLSVTVPAACRCRRGSPPEPFSFRKKRERATCIFWARGRRESRSMRSGCIHVLTPNLRYARIVYRRTRSI